MIQLYAKGTTNFSKNGIELHPSESTVTFQDNGQYDVELVMPAQGDYTAFDYGQVLRVTVPTQHLAQVNLGAVSYFTISKTGGTPLYSVLPSSTRVRYKAYDIFSSREMYAVGTKVTYNGQNYQLASAYYPTPTQENPMPGYSQHWVPISNYKDDPGKTITTLAKNDVVMRIRNYNSDYAEVATLDGKQGYVKRSDYTARGDSGSRTVPARTIETQTFIITEITKEQSDKTIRVVAEHISYQLGRTMLEDCNVVNVNPITALMLIRGAMQESYSGKLYTNVTGIDIKEDWSWKNAQQALLDPKTGVLEKTNGWIVRDDLDIFILTEAAQTPKYSVRYGANMKNVKWKGDVSGIVTRVYPIAKTEDGSTLTLPEKYIDTSRTIPFVKPEKLDTKLKVGSKVTNSDGTKVELTESQVYTRMRQMANARFTVDKCDRADVTLELDWVHMPDTEEYAEYTALSNAEPGDWVEVVNGPLGISEMIKLTGYTWDPILERYKTGKFGANKEKASVAGYNIQNGSVTGSAIANGSISGSEIMAETITAREIETNSVTAEKISSKSIITELIAANAVTADEINANAVTAEKIAAGAVTTQKLDAGAVTAAKLAAGSVDADKIDAGDIDAINAKLGTAEIADAQIAAANIGFAQIVDADIHTLIAYDAITDRYYIDKLKVNNATAVYAQVGELVVKASDNHYYRLDIAADGSLSATDVTSDLTQEEITSGETSDGRASIIETDLTAAELSASNLKAISALISKLTAARIDVAELFARQATISELNTVNISNNESISIAVRDQMGQGKVWMQAEEPDRPATGDIWHKLISIAGTKTWEELESYTWEELESQQWGELSADYYETYRWNGDEWILTEGATKERVDSVLDDGDGIITGIRISRDGLRLDGEKFIRLQSGQTNMELNPDGIRMRTGEQTNVEISGEGVEMYTAGRAYLHAKDASNSAIIFGTDKGNANFSVGIQGDLYAKSVNADNLFIGENEVPTIIVADRQPEGENILWFKPNSQTSKSWTLSPSSKKLDTRDGLEYYRDFYIPYNAADYLAGSLYYGIAVTLYVYSRTSVLPNVTLSAQLKNGSNWISLGSVTKQVQSDGTYAELNKMLTSAKANVMNVDGGYFVVRLTTNYPSGRCRLSTSIKFKAKSVAVNGASACSVFYID